MTAPPTFRTLELTLHAWSNPSQQPQRKPQESLMAVLTLCSEPVNVLSMQVWSELWDALKWMESPESRVRGFILTARLKKCGLFTAGNDLRQLYAPMTSAEAYRAFWLKQSRFLARLYRSPLVTVGAIPGHAPAGGCGMALCCDYRIMTDSKAVPGALIGLNEPAIGIPVPRYWAALMGRVIGSSGRADRLIQFGQMVSAERALDLALVDELVSDGDMLLSVAMDRLRDMLRVPDKGRQLTKKALREEFSLAWEGYAEEEAVQAWSMLSDPAVVQELGRVLKRLGGDKSSDSKL